MLLSWPQLLWWQTLLWLCTSNGLCPSHCDCKQTEKGENKVLCLKGGMIEPIPTNDMDANMEILEISAPNNNWNTFTTILPIFQRFKSLTEIHIKNSNIKQIAMHAFWGVPSLKLLDMTSNNLSILNDHNFRGLVDLIELNLDDNRIKHLQTGVFKYLTELKILTLQRNLLDELVPRMFLKLAKLHVLKLNENKFEELNPVVFKDIPELRVFECRGCNLRRINPQIYHLLPYLSYLDLGNNQMQFLDVEEFNDLKKLHSLKLDGNMLPVILDKTFRNQKQLKYLCLARNRLAKITNSAFVNLTNLIHLDIGHNKLDKLDSVVLQHISDTLQRLVISGNLFSLSVIKNVIHSVYKVWHLDMAKLNIKYLPENFLPNRIKILNISYNNLSDITLHMLPKQLIELDLSFNKLKGIPENVLYKFEEMKMVNLTNNSWSCNLCHITPIIYHINRSEIFKNHQCASPNYLKGRLLDSLDFHELKLCKSKQNSDYDEDDRTFSDFSSTLIKYSIIIAIICFFVFFVFCIIFIVWSFVRRRTRNLTQEQKRIARRIKEETSLDNPTAIFCKGEISFKFPLDLTERKVSVSTIDEIKKDTQLQALPNGTGI